LTPAVEKTHQDSIPKTATSVFGVSAHGVYNCPDAKEDFAMASVGQSEITIRWRLSKEAPSKSRSQEV